MSIDEPTSSVAYIRRDECIRISSGTGDAENTGLKGATIVGVGAHNDQPSFTTTGRFLMGEVEEITILDQNMNTLAVHNKSSHARYSVQKSAEKKREEMLKKRNDLQRRHDDQTQALNKKHEEERNKIEHHPNFTDEEMEYVLTNVMEPMHQKQLRLMQERHQKEQAVLMDLMFKSAFGVDEGGSQNSHNGSEEKTGGHRKDPPEHPYSQRPLTSEHLESIDESVTTSSIGTGTSVDESSVGSSVSSSVHARNTALSPVPESPNPEANQVIYNVIKKVKSNDPTLHLLELDGQDGVPKKLWKKLFKSIETNEHVNQISLQGCNMSDETLVPLLLSLVENNTVLAINLSGNRQVTDETGKLLVKVLRGGNEKIYDIDLSKTSVSSTLVSEIDDILAERFIGSN